MSDRNTSLVGIVGSVVAIIGGLASGTMFFVVLGLVLLLANLVMAWTA